MSELVKEERNIEALKQLRRVVEETPDEKFDMAGWSRRKPCGTVHCAAGHAAFDPWFQANTKILKAFAIDGDWLIDITDEFDLFGELALIFGITIDESICLFDPGDNRSHESAPDVTREEVITQIDKLIAGEEIDEYPPAFDD